MTIVLLGLRLGSRNPTRTKSARTRPACRSSSRVQESWWRNRGHARGDADAAARPEGPRLRLRPAEAHRDAPAWLAAAGGIACTFPDDGYRLSLREPCTRLELGCSLFINRAGL